MHGVHSRIMQEIDRKPDSVSQASTVGRMGEEIEIDARRHSGLGSSESHRTPGQRSIQSRTQHSNAITMRVEARFGDELEVEIAGAALRIVRAQSGTSEPIGPQALRLSRRANQRGAEIDDTMI